MKYFKYILFISLILLQVSCSKEKNTLLEDGVGYLRFGFSHEEDILVTRAGVAAEPVFSVKVIDLATGVQVKSTEDHREWLDKPLKLRAGEYNVIATSGENIDAGFEKPYYVGENKVTVQDGATAVANVVCKLANVKVSVLIDPTVERNFTKYVVTVDNSDNGILIFDKAASTLTKYGYIKCTGTLNWKIDLVNNNGTSNQYGDKIINVQPRQHYRLKFAIDENGDKNTGGASLNITVDETTKDVNHDLNIPLNKKPAPSIKGKDFDYESSLMVQIGSETTGELEITAPAGFSYIILQHDHAEISALGIPSQFNLAEMLPSELGVINNAGILWDNFTVGDVALVMNFKKFLSKLPLGQYQFKIKVKDNQSQYISSDFNIVIMPDVEVTTLGADAWAKRAIVRAKWNTISMPTGMGFKYKEDASQEWITVTDGIVFGQSGSEYTLELKGLKPNTKYQYQSISAKDDQTNIMSFTTELDAQLPNMSFDGWVKSGKSWFPNVDLEAGYFWDTANAGANTISEVNPTRPEEVDVAVKGPGKKAAKLVSSSVLGIMAAGNIYSGQFVERKGTTAILDWGRPFTSRPTTLKGYYKYQPKTIDKAKAPYENMMGKTDECQIFVALMDWKAPHRINSSEANYINFDTDPHVIAYGQLTDNKTTTEYQQFSIDIQYRDNRKPTYIVMVCVASKYGDYFTGGIGSTLFVDELEFVY